MPCTNPQPIYRSNKVNPSTGKRGFANKFKDGFHDMPARRPCGQCLDCRLGKARNWAIRCAHEIQMHPASSFVTLTYSPENLPWLGSLQHRDFQLFMKRLRERVGYKLRYFMCGEYGEKLQRPHYHAILFGIDFSHDRDLIRRGKHPLYRSPLLDDTWQLGHASIGEANFETASYIARYVTKKITGPSAPDHYERLDEYGEYRQIQPEYQKMSRAKGIGFSWLEKFSSDVYPHDEIIHAGRKLKPPSYYDKLYDLSSPDEFASLKIRRRLSRKTCKCIVTCDCVSPDQTFERLAVREELLELKLQQQPRKLEK